MIILLKAEEVRQAVEGWLNDQMVGVIEVRQVELVEGYGLEFTIRTELSESEADVDS